MSSPLLLFSLHMDLRFIHLHNQEIKEKSYQIFEQMQLTDYLTFRITSYFFIYLFLSQLFTSTLSVVYRASSTNTSPPQLRRRRRGNSTTNYLFAFTGQEFSYDGSSGVRIFRTLHLMVLFLRFCKFPENQEGFTRGGKADAFTGG